MQKKSMQAQKYPDGSYLQPYNPITIYFFMWNMRVFELLSSFATGVRLFVVVLAFAYVARDYYKYRYETLKYLFLATLFFLIIEIPRAVIPETSDATTLRLISVLPLTLLFLKLSIFFLLLFFEAYVQDNVLSGNNLFYLSIIVATTAMMIPHTFFFVVVIETQGLRMIRNRRVWSC